MTGNVGLTEMSACEVVDLLNRGEITPLDCLDALEARLAAVDGVVNALPHPLLRSRPRSGPLAHATASRWSRSFGRTAGTNKGPDRRCWRPHHLWFDHLRRLSSGAIRHSCTRVEEAHPDLSQAHDTFQVMRGMAFATSYGALLEYRDKMKPEVVWNIENGLSYSMADAVRAENNRAAMFRRMNATPMTCSFVRPRSLQPIPQASDM
jgi:hypothetical protein